MKLNKNRKGHQEQRQKQIKGKKNSLFLSTQQQTTLPMILVGMHI